MSISTLESPASRNALAQFFAQADARANSERGLAQAFEAAARKLNVQDIATFAGLTKDWEAHRAGRPNAKRMQTVAEVMADSLDQGDGPSTAEVMALLCAVAWGNESQTLRARDLINRMSWAWAQQNAEAA